MKRLCEQMHRAPIKTLSLTDNDLKDEAALRGVVTACGGLRRVCVWNNDYKGKAVKQVQEHAPRGCEVSNQKPGEEFLTRNL